MFIQWAGWRRTCVCLWGEAPLSLDRTEREKKKASRQTSCLPASWPPYINCITVCAMMGWNPRNGSQKQILPSFTCSPQGFVTLIAVWRTQFTRSSRDSLTDRVKNQSVSGICTDPLTPTWHHSSPLPCTAVKRNCWNISELLHALSSLSLSANIYNPSLCSANTPYYAPFIWVSISYFCEEGWSLSSCLS